MKRLHALRCIAAALLLLSAVCRPASALSDEYAEPINLAIDRWLTVQKPSGFMPYGFNFLENRESEPETLSAENLTRQAGTASALADYYALTKDERAKPALQQYLRAFGRHSLPIGKRRLQRLVESTRLLSIPIGRYKIHAALKKYGLLYETTGPGKVLSPDADYGKAYTGALALALLTEVRYSSVSGDGDFADLRGAWLEALIGLRIPGAGFRLTPTSIDATPYFDGEAWLALAEYNRAFRDDRRASEFLADLDAALMGNYGRQFNIDFFHWGTMAAAARFADTKDKRFLDFVKAQTGAFLDRRKKRPDNSNNCASVEGVADAIGALHRAGEGKSELTGRAREWIAAEMRKARQLQIRPGQKELVFLNARIVAPRIADFAGSFRSALHAADTRVDFTQHCVSAMVKLERVDALASGN